MRLTKYWGLCILIIMSCSDSSIIGDDLVGDDNFQISFMDTVSLDMYTVKFDSLPTSSTGRLVVGNNTNEYLGDVIADAYFLLSPNSNFGVYSVDDYEVFDSVTMVFYTDGYSYILGEDDVSRELVVEQLRSDLNIPTGDTYLYNYSVPPRAADDLPVLGRKNIRFSQDEVDEIEITLDYEFGSELFELIREVDEVLLSSTEFYEYMNGFKVSFDNSQNDTPFIGLDVDSIRLNIYYTNPRSLPIEQEVFSFYVDNAPYYTHYSNTNIPDVYDELKTIENELSTDSTDHLGHMAGGLGYAIRVDFPSIRSLLLDGKDYVIAGAELRLRPLDVDKDARRLPERLKGFYVTESNVTVSDEVIYASLVYDEEYGRDTYYVMDIGVLVEQLLQDLTVYEYSVLLTIDDDDLNTSMTSVVMGDESFDSELILYTITNK